MIIILSFLMSLAVSLILTPIMIRVAFMIGATDQPNERKVHSKIMPRFGGVAIFLAFFLTSLIIHNKLSAYKFIISSYIELDLIQAAMFGGALIVILGALDDRFELSAAVKLLGQISIALYVTSVYNIKIEISNYLPFLNDNTDFKNGIAVLLTVLWILLVTNAINLIDGLDGLAAGVVAISTTSILIVSILKDFNGLIFICAVLLGALIGFLVFNFHPAKIFMGDSGSMFLGFILALLSMGGVKQVTLVSFVTPLLVIGVPLYDTVFAIIRRLVNKKPIFKPDKNHLHHCLKELGFSHRKTVLIIYSISIFFALLAVLQSLYGHIYSVSNWITFGVVTSFIIILQLGAELLGIVDPTKKPLINFFKGLFTQLFFHRRASSTEDSE